MKNLDTIVIVVDAATLRPMFWGGEQFLFVPALKLTSTRKNGYALKTYKRCDALLLIKADYQFRLDSGLAVHPLMLMLAKHGKC